MDWKEERGGDGLTYVGFRERGITEGQNETLMRCPISLPLAGLSRRTKRRACRIMAEPGSWLEVEKP